MTEEQASKESQESTWEWKYAIKDEQGARGFHINKKEALDNFSKYFDKYLPSGNTEFSRIVTSIMENDGVTQTVAEERAWRAHQNAVDVHAQAAFEHFSRQFLKVMNDFYQAVQMLAISQALDELRSMPFTLKGETCELVFKHADRNLLQRDVMGFMVASTKDMTGRKGPGQHSPWTSEMITKATQGAVELLRQTGERPTYDNINKVLKEHFGDRAPESGEALRKLLKRLGLNLKAMITGEY